MPIFEYMCQSCGVRFEKLILSSRSKKRLDCPKCGSQDVEKAISLFSSTGSNASRGAANCAPSG